MKPSLDLCEVIEVYKQSVLPLIVDNYYNFTAVEKTIADYFISNSKKEDFSSKAMKERLFVSEASLSRFAKKCGFKGYREFIYRYEEGFTEKREQHSSEFKEVLNIYDQILKDTVHFVNEDQIKYFCQVLSDAKYVSVLGIGSSGLVAREMKFRFMRLGIIMEALDKSDDMKMQAVLQSKGALFIGISLSGKKEDVIFSLKKAHQNGATTILITANTEDEFPYCDEVMRVAGLKGLDAGHIISPQFPILVFLDICYYYYYHNVACQSSELHKRTVDVLSEE